MKCSTAILMTLLLGLPSAFVRGASTSSQTEKKTSSKAKAKAIAIDDIQLDDDVPAIENERPAREMDELVSKADALEKAKDSRGVVALLRPSLEKLSRRGLLQIARAYRSLGESMNEVHTLEIATAKNPKDYVTQTLLGDGYLKLKRYEDAGKAYAAARAVNNRYHPAYDGQWALLEQDDSKYEARTLVLDMIKTFGPDAKTSAALCRMYSGEDFLDKTVEACRSAISINKENPENYVYLAMSLRDQDHKDEAIKVSVEAAKKFLKSEKVQVLAGEFKVAEKDFADAYGFYQHAVAANPKSPVAQVGLANSAFELQKHSEAIESYKIACKLDRKLGRDFRAAALTAKKNQDPKWMAYQNALDACN